MVCPFFAVYILNGPNALAPDLYINVSANFISLLALAIIIIIMIITNPIIIICNIHIDADGTQITNYHSADRLSICKIVSSYSSTQCNGNWNKVSCIQTKQLLVRCNWVRSAALSSNNFIQLLLILYLPNICIVFFILVATISVIILVCFDSSRNAYAQNDIDVFLFSPFRSLDRSNHLLC